MFRKSCVNHQMAMCKFQNGDVLSDEMSIINIIWYHFHNYLETVPIQVFITLDIYGTLTTFSVIILKQVKEKAWTYH